MKNKKRKTKKKKKKKKKHEEGKKERNGVRERNGKKGKAVMKNGGGEVKTTWEWSIYRRNEGNLLKKKGEAKRRAMVVGKRNKK